MFQWHAHYLPTNVTAFNFLNDIPPFVRDLLLTELSVYHTNYSSSHAYGVVIYLMLPYYLEIDEDVEIKGPPLCVKTSEAGVKFHVSLARLDELFN